MNGVQREYVTHARNYDYEVVCGAANSTYPTKYEIPRENTGTLKNQGSVAACVSEVITQIAEHLWSNELEKEEMSEGFSYASLRPASLKIPGLYVSKAMELWTTIGTLPKTYFDKLCEMPEIKKAVESVPKLYDIASKYKLSGYVTIPDYAKKEKRDLAIKDALMKYNYGLVAVSNDYFSGGSHCIMLTGWDDEKNRYLFKNSWGEDYGDNGFSSIPKDEVNGAVYVPLLEPIELPFTDVPKDAWYYSAIKHVFFNGMMNGTSETTFEPEKPLTRAEVATLINRVLKCMDERFDILNDVLKTKIE